MAKDKSEMKTRREFLKIAGKFAVYTPPTLMIMSGTNVRAMGSSCNQGVGKPVVNDGCQPGRSGEVLNNDDFIGAGPGNPGARK